jgi:NADH-quinone oxidoreductase subunit M
MNAFLLTLVLFLPFMGAILLMLVPRQEEGIIKGLGIGISAATFLVSLALLAGFDNEAVGFQFVADKVWIRSIGVHYKIGIDGISLWLVLLTTFLTPIVLLSAQGAITKKVKEFVISFLILETGMIGAFIALDLFLFYVMWEVMLIPMYFIIGVWGGDRRVYASIKFVIYTLVGSLLMLVAIFYIYIQYGQATGGYTFDLQALWTLQLPKTAQIFCFLAFGLAFAIKVPIFPFHTWLPDAHVEAPTSGSVILAGVLLKFGIYGFLRYCIPLFPAAVHQLGPWLYWLGMIGVLYGAMVAFVQDDVKRLVAYSSVSHLGFCVLGAFALNSVGIEGSIYTMLSHGLTTSGLFLAIGVLYERRHTRKISEFGGLAARMPVFTAMFMIMMLGSAGVPGLSGFVGEFMSLIGAYDAGKDMRLVGGTPYISTPQMFAGIATLGVVFGAVYLLYVFQKVMFGPLTNPKNKGIKDLTAREIFVFIPLVVGVFVLGLYPKPFLAAMHKSVRSLRWQYEKKLENWRTDADKARVFLTPPMPAVEEAPRPMMPRPDRPNPRRPVGPGSPPGAPGGPGPGMPGGGGHP